MVDNDLVRITDNMFDCEKDTYILINNEHNKKLQQQMLLYQIKRYDEISLIHGSGKDLLGSDSYQYFMNDKWGLLFHEVLVFKRLNSYDGDYR